MEPSDSDTDYNITPKDIINGIDKDMVNTVWDHLPESLKKHISSDDPTEDAMKRIEEMKRACSFVTESSSPEDNQSRNLSTESVIKISATDLSAGNERTRGGMSRNEKFSRKSRAKILPGTYPGKGIFKRLANNDDDIFGTTNYVPKNCGLPSTILVGNPIGTNWEIHEICLEEISKSRIDEIFEKKFQKCQGEIAKVLGQIEEMSTKVNECEQKKTPIISSTCKMRQRAVAVCNSVHQLECEIAKIKFEVCGESACIGEESGSFCCKGIIQKIFELQQKVEKVRARAMMKDCYLEMCETANERINVENHVLKNDIKKAIKILNDYETELQEIQKVVCKPKKGSTSTEDHDFGGPVITVPVKLAKRKKHNDNQSHEESTQSSDEESEKSIDLDKDCDEKEQTHCTSCSRRIIDYDCSSTSQEATASECESEGGYSISASSSQSQILQTTNNRYSARAANHRVSASDYSLHTTSTQTICSAHPTRYSEKSEESEEEAGVRIVSFTITTGAKDRICKCLPTEKCSCQKGKSENSNNDNISEAESAHSSNVVSDTGTSIEEQKYPSHIPTKTLSPNRAYVVKPVSPFARQVAPSCVPFTIDLPKDLNKNPHEKKIKQTGNSPLNYQERTQETRHDTDTTDDSTVANLTEEHSGEDYRNSVCKRPNSTKPKGSGCPDYKCKCRKIKRERERYSPIRSVSPKRECRERRRRCNCHKKSKEREEAKRIEKSKQEQDKTSIKGCDRRRNSHYCPCYSDKKPCRCCRCHKSKDRQPSEDRSKHSSRSRRESRRDSRKKEKSPSLHSSKSKPSSGPKTPVPTPRQSIQRSIKESSKSPTQKQEDKIKPEPSIERRETKIIEPSKPAAQEVQKKPSVPKSPKSSKAPTPKSSQPAIRDKISAHPSQRVSQTDISSKDPVEPQLSIDKKPTKEPEISPKDPDILNVPGDREPSRKTSEKMREPLRPDRKPSRPSQKPSEPPTRVPSEPVQIPGSEPIRKSSEPIPKTSEPIRKSSDPTHKPSSPIPKSSDPIRKSSDPIRKSSDPIRKSSDPVRKSSGPTRKSSGPTRKSSGPTRKSSDLNRKSSEPTRQPSDPIRKPSRPLGKPSGPIQKSPDQLSSGDINSESPIDTAKQEKEIFKKPENPEKPDEADPKTSEVKPNTPAKTPVSPGGPVSTTEPNQQTPTGPKTIIPGNQDLKDCQTKLEQCEAARINLASEQDGIRTKLNRLEAELNNCRIDYQDCLKGDQKDPQIIQHISTLQHENSQLQEQVDNFRKNFEKLKIDNSALTEKNSHLQQELQACHDQMKERPVDCLQFIRRITDLENQVQLMNQQNEDNMRDYSDCKLKLGKCQDDLSQCMKELAREPEDNKVEVEKPLITEDCKEWINLTKKYETLLKNYRLHAVKTAFLRTHLEKQRDDYKAEAEALKPELDKCQKELWKLKNEYTGQPLQAQIDHLLQEIEKHKATINRYEANRTELMKQKEDALEEAKGHKHKLLECEEQIKMINVGGTTYVTEQLGRATKENNLLKTELDEKRIEINKLTNEVKTYNERFEEADEKLKACQAKLEKLFTEQPDPDNSTGLKPENEIVIFKSNSDGSKFHEDFSKLHEDSTNQHQVKDNYHDSTQRSTHNHAEVVPNDFHDQLKEHIYDVRRMRKLFDLLQCNLQNFIRKFNSRPCNENLQDELIKIYHAINWIKLRICRRCCGDSPSLEFAPICIKGEDRVLHCICMKIVLAGIRSLNFKQLVYLHCTVYTVAQTFGEIPMNNKPIHYGDSQKKEQIIDFGDDINWRNEMSGEKLKNLETELNKTKEMLDSLNKKCVP